MLIRPHKVDSQFIVSTFPIIQVGGRSLLIIHWPFSFIEVSHAPQKWVPHVHCKGQRLHMEDHFVKTVTNLGWFLLILLS